MIIKQRVRNQIRTSDGISCKIQTCNSEGSKLCGRPLMSELSRLVSSWKNAFLNFYKLHSSPCFSKTKSLLLKSFSHSSSSETHIIDFLMKTIYKSKDCKAISLSMDSLKKPWLSSIILVNYEFHGFMAYARLVEHLVFVWVSFEHFFLLPFLIFVAKIWWQIKANSKLMEYVFFRFCLD